MSGGYRIDTVGFFLGTVNPAFDSSSPPCIPSLSNTLICAWVEPASRSVATVYDRGVPAVAVMPATIGHHSPLVPVLYRTA